MTTSHHGNRIVGTMRAENGTGTVRMEDVYDTDVADLWTALTNADRLSRWLAEVTGDLRSGGLIQATFTSGWEGPGRIDVCEPPRRLMATMNPGRDDETVLEATLADEAGKTRLVIEERGLPLSDVAAYGAGWQTHVEDLAGYLAGQPRRTWIDRVRELMPGYQALAKDW